MTAVPQPPKVSQNVPISSAAHFFAISLLMRKPLRGARDPSRSARASLSVALIDVRSKLEFEPAGKINAENAGRDLDCPRPALGRICGGTWVFLVIVLNTIRRRDACCHSRGGLE